MLIAIPFWGALARFVYESACACHFKTLVQNLNCTDNYDVAKIKVKSVTERIFGCACAFHFHVRAQVHFSGARVHVTSS